MKIKYLKSILPYLVIFIFGAFIFGFFFAPALYYDDWQNMVGRFYHGLTTWINPDFSRPFRETIWKFLFFLFGFNPGKMLVVDILLKIISTCFLYKLIKDILPSRPYIALPFALLSMVYPADKTRLWLDQLNIGWTLVCVSAWLLFKYSKNGKPWLLLGVVVGYTYALLEYEAILGILTAWAVLLMVLNLPILNKTRQPISWKRWAGLGTPVLLFFGYLFYRIFWVNWIGIGGFHAIKTTGFLSLAINLFKGFKTLAWGWIEPAHLFLPGIPLKWIILGTAALILIWIVLSYYISDHVLKKNDTKQPLTDKRKNEFRRSLILVLAGIILTAAGYFPFITYSPPAIDFFSSRFNTYALVGASLIIVFTIDLLAQAFKWSNRQRSMFFSLAIIPFIFSGAACELLIQNQTQNLWNEYRQMWSGIFQAAPGIKEGSSVVLVIKNTPCKPTAYGERPLIYSNMANWELKDAFNAFYGTQHLSGDFIYQGCGLPYQVQFRGDGFNNPPSYDGVYPYENAIIMIYDRKTRTIKIAQNLMEITGFNNPEYQPDKLITSGPEPNAMRFIMR